MPAPSTPAFPDALYTEQAAYLAEHTDLSPREAEAHLRRIHTPDEGDDAVPDRTLAEHMGVNKATFSKHLRRARDKLEGDESIIDSLTTLLHTTDLGGAGSPSRQVIAAKKTLNAFVLISETEFYDEDAYSFPDKYRAHFVYRDPLPNASFAAEQFSDIGHYTRYSVFSVGADTHDEFANSIAAYVDAIDELDDTDLIAVMDLLEDELGLFDLPDTASDIVQDAAGALMARN